MIRRIRDLLYDQGFTISGARNKMQELMDHERDKKRNGEVLLDGVESLDSQDDGSDHGADGDPQSLSAASPQTWAQFRQELLSIRALLDTED